MTTLSRRQVPAILLVSMAAACSGPPKQLPPPTGPDVPADIDAAPTAQATERHWSVVVLGRKAGTYDVSVAPDGTTTATFHVVENGRGPHSDVTYRLGDDGAFTRFEAKGHHTLGTLVDEKMERAGDTVRWRSTEENGEREVSGAAFFIPSADFPTGSLLVPAAIAAGGQLAVLPSGQVRVEKVKEVEVTANGETRRLSCYRVGGLGFAPGYEWLNPDGTYFGFAQPWWSMVPAGWESVVDQLVAEGRVLERDWLAELAKANAHRPPAAGVAYVHARVLDVEKGKWLADQTVIVVGDTISAVGATRKLKVPAGAEVVDLAGKALVPGLVDMHGHVGALDGVLNIASGVTTVRDVGNDPDDLDSLKKDWDSGTTIGTHLVRMGFIEGRNPKAASSKVTAETPEEAKAAVTFFAERGYDGIKIYNSMKVELVPLLAAEAHARKMLVIGHIPVHMLAREAVEAGYDGIEHINMLFLNFLATHETDTRDTTRFTLVGEKGLTLDLDSPEVKDFIALLAKKGTIIDPTLSAFEGMWVGVPGEIPPGLGDTVARMPPLVGRSFLSGGLPLDGDKHATYLKSWERVLQMVKRLHDSGVTVVLGTDHIAGLMLLHETELFARAGIKNADILRALTIVAAKAMRQDKAFGTIAKGKRADLVVIDGDPLGDIHALGRVVTTMRGGVIYPSAPLYRAVGVKPLVE